MISAWLLYFLVYQLLSKGLFLVRIMVAVDIVTLFLTVPGSVHVKLVSPSFVSNTVCFIRSAAT